MKADPFFDPLQFLTACHGRIRQRLFTFRLTAAALRGARAVERHQLEAALLFFRTSGEGHTIDEERSLFPRLRARLEEAGVQEGIEVIDRLLAEHRGHEALLERMQAAMQAIDPTLSSGTGIPDPEAAPIVGGTEEARSLADALEALVEDYESHIPIEDDLLYPLAARLMPAEELAQVAGEMRSRRALGRKLLG